MQMSEPPENIPRHSYKEKVKIDDHIPIGNRNTKPGCNEARVWVIEEDTHPSPNSYPLRVDIRFLRPESTN